MAQSTYGAIGFFSVSHTRAGFADLLSFAAEWARNPAFHELSVRPVSPQDYGVQFVYIAHDVSGDPIDYYRSLARKRFGDGLMEMNISVCTSPDATLRASGVLVLKSAD